MSAQIIKDAPKWLKIPRWFGAYVSIYDLLISIQQLTPYNMWLLLRIGHIILNNFLDQDTFLLATQQKHVLGAESQLSLEAGTESGEITISLSVRKKIYKYRSPR